MYPYLGLIIILATWLSGYILVTRWPGDPAMSLSLHGAANKAAYRLFVFTLVVMALPFGLFMYRWFIPTFALQGLFASIYSVSLGFQIIAGIIPDRPVWQSHIHRFAGYCLALSQFALIILLALSDRISRPAQLVCVLATIYMVGAVGAFAALPKIRPKYLYYQSAYIVAIDVAVLAVTFWR